MSFQMFTIKQTNVTQFYMIGCKIVKRLNKQNYQNNAIACFLFYLELIYGMIYFLGFFSEHDLKLTCTKNHAVT